MKKIFIAALLSCSSAAAFATYGVLPLSGITYYERGLHTKNITAELDGQTWTGQYLPQKGNLNIILEEPEGFAIGKDGNYHPDVDMIILKKGGDTVGRSRSIYTTGNSKGLPGYELKSLKMSLGFDERATIGDTYTVLLSFYDAVPGSKVRLDIRFDALIVKEGYLPAPATPRLQSASGTDGYNAVSNTDIHLREVEAGVDTTGGNKKASIRFAGLRNLAMSEIDKGTFSYYAYDRKATPLYEGAPADNAPKPYYVAVPADGTAGAVNLLILFPLGRGSRAAAAQFIRVRWESTDRSKILDCVFALNE